MLLAGSISSLFLSIEPRAPGAGGLAPALLCLWLRWLQDSGLGWRRMEEQAALAMRFWAPWVQVLLGDTCRCGD